MNDLSIVIPVFNEEEALPLLFQRLDTALSDVDFSYEVVFVNDSSEDRSLGILLDYQKVKSNVCIINLSRNFGHQPAITAGLNNASGRSVVIMDADLQDPPEEIPKFISEWRKGFQVVVGVRSSRKEGLLRKTLFKLFYKVFGTLTKDGFGITSGVFGLMDRVVVDHLINLTEQNRFIPGLRSWIGFKQTYIAYDREQRKAGIPQQTLLKLMKYGFDAIFSFSYIPLRLSWLLGFFVSTVSFLYGLFLVFLRIFNINVVPGFTTPTVVILFLGGIQLLSIGIVGEYLGRVYDEVKQRPLYIISRTYWSSDRKTETKSNLSEDIDIEVNGS